MNISVSECVKRQALKLLSLWQLLVPSTCFRYSMTADVMELSNHSFSFSLFRMSCVMVPAYSAQKVSTLRSSRSRQWSHSLMYRQHYMIFPQQQELSLQGRLRKTRLSSSSSSLNFLKTYRDLRQKVDIYRWKCSRVGRERQRINILKSEACQGGVSCFKGFILCLAFLTASREGYNYLILSRRGRFCWKCYVTTANLFLINTQILAQLQASLSLLSKSQAFRLTDRVLSIKLTFPFRFLSIFSRLLSNCFMMSSLILRKVRSGCFLTKIASSCCPFNVCSPSSYSYSRSQYRMRSNRGWNMRYSYSCLRLLSSLSSRSSASSTRTPERYSTSGMKAARGCSQTQEKSLGSTSRGRVFLEAFLGWRLSVQPLILRIIIISQSIVLILI